MHLRIIVTGGTFDKHYDALLGELTFAKTHLEAIVKRCRLTVPVEIEVATMLDSLDMQESDRKRVLASCLAARERAVVIVHGTDTMTETAALLAPTLAESGKTVILTGAMVPYEIRDSDALFNLGFACAAAQLAAPGVYIAMNGRIHDGLSVRKNREQGVFEASTS
jgi:L-asparaginase